MKIKDELEGSHKRRQRSHPDRAKTPYLGKDPLHGVPIQCQYCSGQAFRRSTLRGDDFNHIFFMRYPVRCLRCSQRQLVSFTIAGISVPSHVKQRRARHASRLKHWTHPSRESLRPPARPASTDTHTSDPT